MNDFKTYLSLIFPYIKDFVQVSVQIHKALGREEIVGCNATTPSLLRKDYVLERINEQIKEKNLPLIVEDTNPYSNQFSIKIITDGIRTR